MKFWKLYSLISAEKKCLDFRTASDSAGPAGKIDQTVLEAADKFEDHKEWVSGWLHDFVCPVCSSMLSFHDDKKDYEQNRFFCPNCNTTVSGEKYREAWVYFHRRYNAENLIIFALASDKPENIDFLIRFVDFYSDNYCSFQEHGQHVGKGKIQAQSLDEAVWGIHVVRAIYWSKKQIPALKLQQWYEALFRPMAMFLKDQAQRIHNISVWIQCFIGMTGILFEDEQLTDDAVNGSFGLMEQLQEGLTDDCLWREGSLHYHYYVLEALTYFCELYCNCSLKSPLLLTMKEMYRSPMRFSGDGYHLPSFNDGWFPLTIGSYASQIIRAAIITNDNELLAQAEMIRKMGFSDVFDEPSVRIVQINCRRESSLLLNNHMGIIKSPLHLILKSGSIVPTHAHRDVLSITITGFSSDLGTPGYGSPIIKTWYRNSLSHNTVSIDGTQPADLFNSVVHPISNGLEAVLSAVPGNDLIRAKRLIQKDGNALTDRLYIETKNEHTFDWTFHSEWPLFFSTGTVVNRLTQESNLYPLFENTAEVLHRGILKAEFVSESGEILQMSISIPENMKVFVAETPGNPSDEKRNTILLRITGNKAEFSVHWEIRHSGLADKMKKMIS